MTPPTAKSQHRIAWLAAGMCALAGVAVFQFFGNATRGYIDTPSTFWWWVSQWIDPRAEAEHGWLVLVISGWLLWRNVRAQSLELRDQNPELRVAAGAGRAGQSAIGRRLGGDASPCLAMVVGLALHAVGFVAQQTRVSIVALLIFTWGALRLGGGPRWGRAAVFPLGFLLFALPVNVLDTLGFWLRLWVIDAAGWFAHLVGIDVVRSGTQLFAPDGRYQYDVAAACSGVRSLMALAALSLLVGYLSFRSAWRRGLMLLLCLPLTYVGNVIRIGAIVLAAQWGGQRWGERAHDVMGFGVFVIVLGGVLLAARAIERWWPEPSPAGFPHAETDVGGREPDAVGLQRDDGIDPPERQGDLAAEPGAAAERRRGPSGWTRALLKVLPVGLVLAVAVGDMLFLARVATAPATGGAGVRLTADGRDPIDLPPFVGTDWVGRRAEVTAIERAILPADTGFSRRTYVCVPNPTHQVFVSIVLSGRDRTSIHRPELCLVGQGWTLDGRGAHRFELRTAATAAPATLLHTRRTEPRTGREMRAIVAYWFVSSEALVGTHWERVLQDAWNRVRHGRADRWAYVLMQADAADGADAALGRMQAVLDGTAASFLAGMPER